MGLACLACLGIAGSVSAQGPDGGVPETPAEGSAAPATERPSAASRAAPRPASPEDEAVVDPGSPQASMARFFMLARAGRFEEAAEYLELRPDDDGPTAARRLALVLDRRVWVDVERLPSSASGDTRDDLPAGVDEIARVPTPGATGETEPVRIVRRSTESGVRWHFTRTTTARIEGWYERLEGRYLLDRVPTRLLREGPYHVAQWQWLGFALLVPLSLLVGILLAGLLQRIALALARRTTASWDDDLVTALLGPTRLALALLLFDAALPQLGLARPVAESMHRGRGLLLVLVTLVAVMRTVRVFATQLSISEWGRTNPASRSLVTLAARTGQVVAVVLAALAVLSSLGYDVTGVLAGLGVGGVVLALAAQKTLENVLGAFAIGIDQPLREGDQVRIDGTVGIVERVGLRSTRIRTLDRHVVSYPNGKLADLAIESISSRDRMRLFTTLGLEYGLAPDAVRAIRDALEAVARAHPRIYADELHVRFAGFGGWSLDFEIMLWLDVRDYGSFVAAREELMLGFMQAVAEHGGRFAFPSRTVHLAREGAFPGVSPSPGSEGSR